MPLCISISTIRYSLCIDLDNIEMVKNGDMNEAKKNSRNVFIVLIIITIFGTVLASPAATLADTATLENLSKY